MVKGGQPLTGVAGVSPAPSGLFTSGMVKDGQPGVAEVPPASSGLFTSGIVKGGQPLTGVAGDSPASFSLFAPSQAGLSRAASP